MKEKLYTKLPIPIKATQWFKNGDHPNDNCKTITWSDGKKELTEGKVIRYYRHPDFNGKTKCKICGDFMHNHGRIDDIEGNYNASPWIDKIEGGYTICPSDWIITDTNGKYYPCKDDMFKKTYIEFKEK